MLRKPLTIALAACLLAACNKKGEEPEHSTADQAEEAAGMRTDTTAADTAAENSPTDNSTLSGTANANTSNLSFTPSTLPSLPKLDTKAIKDNQNRQKERERLLAELNKMQSQLNEHRKATSEAAHDAQQPTEAQIDHMLDNYEYLISSVRNFSDIGIPRTHSHAAKFNSNYDDVCRKVMSVCPFMTKTQTNRFNKIDKELKTAMKEWETKTGNAANRKADEQK